MSSELNPMSVHRGSGVVGPEVGRVQVALLTPRGRGALAVVGVAGGGACDLADRRFVPRGGRPLAARADGSICVGTWHGPDGAGTAGEELVVVRISAERLEIHCHGGLAASEAVLESLAAGGAIRQTWQAWAAAVAGSEIELAGRLLLAGISGPRNAQIMTRQLAGSLERELERIGSRAAGKERVEAIERLLRAARVGLRLAAPWSVVLTGPVNAGKSSLANALAGHGRSIVSAEPGTTRDLVTTRLVLGGWEIDLIDSAGLRPDALVASATERAGIARARAAVAQADLVVRVESVERHAEVAGPVGARELRVVTKADLAEPGWEAPADAVVTSGRTGRGITELAAAIVARLVPEERDEPGLLAGAVPFTHRQVALLRDLLEAVKPPVGAEKESAGGDRR